MKRTVLTLLLLPLATVVFAQEAEKQQQPVTDSIISYRVSMGETIIMIAKKYHITPHDIYELNPAAVNGINENTILKLPNYKIVHTEEKKKPKPAQAVATSTD